MRAPQFGVLAAAGGAGAGLVGAKVMAAATGADAITWPGVPAIGDLACVMTWDGIGAGSATITGGTGGQASWAKSQLAWSSYGYNSTVQWKLLGAGDLSGLTLNSGGSSEAALIIFRGATVLSIKSTEPGASGSSLSLTGFTKSGSCKAVVSIVQDRDPTASMAPPGTFVLQASGVGGNFAAAVATITNPSNYVNGTVVTWTGFAATLEQVGWLIELT